MSNLRTKFVGYLSEGENIEAMSSSLNLDDDEKEGLAKIGERGYWLVKKIIGPSLSHYVEAACGS